MVRSSKLILAVTFTWLAGSTGLRLGQLEDAVHRFEHAGAAVPDHSHQNHHESHSHDQDDPHHVPLPFDSFGPAAAHPALSHSVLTFRLDWRGVVALLGASPSASEKDQWSYRSQAPPLIPPIENRRPFSTRAPPSLA